MSRIVKSTVGTGITSRKVAKIVYDPNDDKDTNELRFAFEHRNKRLQTLWGANQAILDSARAELHIIKIEAGRNDDLDRHNSFFRERETKGWFLRSIDIERSVAELAMQQGNAFEAVQAALKIGELLAELRLKLLWEPAAVAGASTLEGAKLGGQIRAAQFANRHAAIVADYNERLARLRSSGRAKEGTAKHFEISRRQLNRILAK